MDYSNIEDENLRNFLNRHSRKHRRKEIIKKHILGCMLTFIICLTTIILTSIIISHLRINWISWYFLGLISIIASLIALIVKEGIYYILVQFTKLINKYVKDN
jgi:hypothetical protein